MKQSKKKNSKTNPRGAGRKPMPESEKKIQVSIYVKNAIVLSKGGKKEFQNFLFEKVRENKNNWLGL